MERGNLKCKHWQKNNYVLIGINEVDEYKVEFPFIFTEQGYISDEFCNDRADADLYIREKMVNKYRKIFICKLADVVELSVKSVL